MGASYHNENNENRNIIWIDKNINNKENTKYLIYLNKRKFKIDTYDDIFSGLNEILFNEDKYFKDIYIILNGSLYQDFILQFKKFLIDIFVVPKIIILTNNKELFLEKNSNIKDIIENKFYNLGGIQTLFKRIFIKKIMEKKL